jgi:transposase
MGHQVTLLPAQHVTPFVRGNKSDRNDALAIAEASQRPNISAVPIKCIEQQDIQSLHRIRERYIAHRTGLMNQTRGLLAEYGIVVPQGNLVAALHLKAEELPNEAIDIYANNSFMEPERPCLAAKIKMIR